ncbi:MAG: hypothetical protein K6G54_07360, partial [Oscillospiraceae bacterium]|nr:hypothetical protein [Oscillospiraceae bacterium]
KAVLREALALLLKVRDMVCKALDGETDALDSVPENLRFSDACASMEVAVDALNSALDHIDDARDDIKEATEV